MIVVDASVAIKWSVVEAGHDEARALVGSLTALAAPAVIVPEVANVLRKKVKRGEIAWHQAELAMAALPRSIGRLVDVSAWNRRIIVLSRTLDHAAYDCCYIACAEEFRAALLTEDQVLASKARLAGLKAVSLADWRTI